MATAKQKPRKVATMVLKRVIEPDFHHLHNEVMDYLNALSCAVEALVNSDALDGCEIGGKARNTVRLCEINLHRLVNDLDKWHATHKHAPKGVAHG